jgi:ribonuclease P protein component
MSQTDRHRGFGFTRADRLHGGEAFRRVLNARCSAGDGRLVVYVAPGEAGRSRLGLVVGRQVGRAHHRNRIKRLLREAFRTSRDRLPADTDIVVVVKPDPPDTLAACRHSLIRLAAAAAKRHRRRAEKHAAAEDAPAQEDSF